MWGDRRFFRGAALLLPLVFSASATLPGADCNRNGVDDRRDIQNGASEDCNRNGIPDECDGVLPVFDSRVRFRRGDCNGDGRVAGQVTDAVFLLNYNFSAGAKPPCLAACDANGDGRVEGQVTDAVYLLTFNFLAGAPPVEPFPDCRPGALESDQALGCETPPESCQ